MPCANKPFKNKGEYLEKSPSVIKTAFQESLSLPLSVSFDSLGEYFLERSSFMDKNSDQ